MHPVGRVRSVPTRNILVPHSTPPEYGADEALLERDARGQVAMVADTPQNP